METSAIDLGDDPVHITTFYRFLPLAAERLNVLQSELEQHAAAHKIRGLCLLSTEGINATFSGLALDLEGLKQKIRHLLGVEDLNFKDSEGRKHPFQIFKVKVKEEIVSLGKPDLVPGTALNNHLSPSAWQEAMQDPETVILDTRNIYEVEVGKFNRAIDFKLSEFNEFPRKLKESNLHPKQRVLMYCTGGIRCEKAILEMRSQGFKNVYQLDGGILNYLQEFPNREFQGECFVFDYRVAVDQQLQPTQQYKLCPHCGQPAQTRIHCSKCGRDETICHTCHELGVKACSKNCAHHASINSDSTGIHLGELSKRRRI